MVPSTFFWCFHYNLLLFSHSSICILLLQLHTTKYKIVRQLETKFTFLRIRVKQKIVVSATTKMQWNYFRSFGTHRIVCTHSFASSNDNVRCQCFCSIFTAHLQYEHLSIRDIETSSSSHNHKVTQNIQQTDRRTQSYGCRMHISFENIAIRSN